MDVLPLATVHLDGLYTAVVGPGWIRGGGLVKHGGHPLRAPDKPDERLTRAIPMKQQEKPPCWVMSAALARTNR